MNKRILLPVGIVIAILVIYVISAYNHLVTLQQGVQASWAQVQNVYERRLDLIPNLVATVQGYAKHERETLIAVIQARNQAQSVVALNANTLPNATKLAQIETSQDALSATLGKLMVVVERYPDLKASQNFLALQYELAGTENRIAVERRRFNEATMAYDVAIRRFPNNILANMFGFSSAAYFQAQPNADIAPKVSF